MKYSWAWIHIGDDNTSWENDKVEYFASKCTEDYHDDLGRLKKNRGSKGYMIGKRRVKRFAFIALLVRK